MSRKTTDHDGPGDVVAALRELAQAVRANTAAIAKLTAMIDVSSARAVTTRRVKAVRAAAKATALGVPVSKEAALAARRALARLSHSAPRR